MYGLDRLGMLVWAVSIFRHSLAGSYGRFLTKYWVVQDEDFDFSQRFHSN